MPIPLLLRYRLALGFFILGLILSGVTAFPLLLEMRLLCDWMGIDPLADPATLTGLARWIQSIRLGLAEVYERHPWVGYGTDWLAFSHLIIAVFFIGPFRAPVRNVWVIHAGLIACAAVIPLAFICGQIRGIPLGWRLIDCSFGLLGALPLLYCLWITPKLQDSLQNNPTAIIA